jgi:hypothetical protein
MPKATLTFELPDERLEHLAACHAQDALSALGRINTALRDRLKYGELQEEAQRELEDLRQILFEAMESLPEELRE